MHPGTRGVEEAGWQPEIKTKLQLLKLGAPGVSSVPAFSTFWDFLGGGVGEAQIF